METLAPPVVAVVVTHDPGPWFEESLEAWAGQDYPALSVLVLDAASAEDPTPRVASVLPEAYVRRLDANRGFGATADEALAMVQGASHLVFCHDDVAPDPDAIRLMVEEAYRSNAGIVAPKLVDWDDPGRLLHVGMAVDKAGAVVDRVEPGELDHGQHDAVRDVFLAPGGCTLVRADLFAELGGFDPEMVAMGEDLDLCWRAQVAGARVVVAPAARVRHLQLLASGRRELSPDLVADTLRPGHRPLTLQALQRRHELRAALKCYGRGHLLRVLPQLVALSLAEVLVALVTGHRDRAATVVHAWGWNLRRRRVLRRERATVAAVRRLADTEVRHLQLRGSARLTGYLRRALTYGLHVAHLGGPAAVAVPDEHVIASPDAPAAGRSAAGGQVGAARAGGAGVIRDVAAGADGEAAVREGPATGDPTTGDPATGDRATVGRATVGRATVGPATADPANGAVGAPAVPAGLAESPAAVAAAALAAERVARPSDTARLVVWGATTVVIVAGSRGLLGEGFPAVGQLVAVPSWSTMLGRFFGGWSPAGLGPAHPASPGLALLGVAGMVLMGAVGLLAKVVVLGCIPLGALGMSRLARPLRSPAGRMVAVVAYLAMPVAWNALATGRWDALLAYGAAPWILAQLARASGAEPFGSIAGEALAGGAGLAPWRSRVVLEVLGLGLVQGALAALVPTTAVLTLVCGLGLAAGCVLAGGAGWRRAAARVVAQAAGATAVAAFLLAPWLVWQSAGTRPWSVLLGAALPAADGPNVGALTRLAVGPIGDTWLAWGFVVAAALPLLVGRSWRQVWSARLWGVALVAWALAWLSGRGWLGASTMPANVLLVPAAVALALSMGMAVVTFDADLRGRRFGWRQLATGAAALAAVAGCLPMLAAASGGHWDLPVTGYDQAVSWTARTGDSRIVWIGDPRALPGAGWPLGRGAAFTVSERTTPDIASLWPGPSTGAVAAVGHALAEVRSGATVDLGRQLAPYGIRYVVVLGGAAPSIAGLQSPLALPAPADLTAGLARQIDLQHLPAQGGYDLFINSVAGNSVAGPVRGSDRGHGGALGGVVAVADALVWLGVAILAVGGAGRLRRRVRVPAASGAVQRGQPEPGALRATSVLGSRTAKPGP